MIELPSKENNISEYILYLFQIEDILRFYEFDINRIKEDLGENQLSWYSSIISQMRDEGIEKTGHLKQVKEILNDLSNIHINLLKDEHNKEYSEIYYKTLPFIVELRAKSNNKNISEIETCFVVLYGILLLKLQKKEISENTQNAISQIKKLLIKLSEKYKHINNF